MKRKLTYIFWFCLPLLLLLNACDDMEDKPFTSSDITGDPTETDTAELYALCEGLFNQNNSSLMRFSFNNQRMVRNYFKTINHRGLGDTANDLAIYGSKIYIVNPEKPDVPLNKNDAFQKVQKRRVQEKR